MGSKILPVLPSPRFLNGMALTIFMHHFVCLFVIIYSYWWESQHQGCFPYLPVSFLTYIQQTYIHTSIYTFNIQHSTVQIKLSRMKNNSILNTLGNTFSQHTTFNPSTVQIKTSQLKTIPTQYTRELISNNSMRNTPNNQQNKKGDDLFISQPHQGEAPGGR